MRTLSESLRGNGTVTNRERLVNESQQQEINSLVNEVEEIHGDIDSLNDRLDEPVLNKDAANITGRVNAGSVHATDGEFIGLTAGSVGATSIDATSVDADEIDVGRLESTTTVTTNATITNATISTADITDANITNFNVDNFTSDEITSEDIMADDIVVNNTLSADVANVPTVNATDIDAVTIDATTVNGTSVNATDLDATYGEIRTLDNHIMENEFIKHDDFYIDVNQVVSDTNFVVIELPNIKSGDYRLTYYNSQMTDILFSFTLNDTKENKWFSYSRALDQKSFDEVAIKDGKLYIKTWYTGRLYFHSDTLDNIVAPKTYGEWPIDTEDLDYPLFSATRIKATVYTHFVNIGMDSQEYGTAVFSYNTTHNWQLVKDQLENANPIEYDPQTDVLAYNYIPDQNVNVDSDVEFGDVEADNVKVNGTVGHTGLEISNIENGQILRKRETDTQMTVESPVDVDTDDQPLSRLSDGILTERTVANWNGATNRQHSQASGGSTLVGNFTENWADDPTSPIASSFVATDVPDVYSYGGSYCKANGTGTTVVNNNLFYIEYLSIDLTDLPANYTYHLDYTEGDYEYYNITNLSGSIGWFVKNTSNDEWYASEYYSGGSDDSYFENFGMVNIGGGISWEYDDNHSYAEITVPTNLYLWLDNFVTTSNYTYAPEGTKHTIDGIIDDTIISASGVTYNYREYQYSTTSHNYVGPTAQNCTIDPNNGTVTPISDTVYGYYREWYKPIADEPYYGPDNRTNKYYLPQDTSPDPNRGLLADSNFNVSNFPTDYDMILATDEPSNWISDLNEAAYVSWRTQNTNYVVKSLSDDSTIMTLTNINLHAITPEQTAANCYKHCVTKPSVTTFSSATADRPDYTVDGLIAGASANNCQYVYALWNADYTQIKYSIESTRNDAAYANKSWSSSWQYTASTVPWDGTTDSWTKFKDLQSGGGTNVFVVGVKFGDTTPFMFGCHVIREHLNFTFYMEKSTTATDWAVYWTADLGTGNTYFQDSGARGNKYRFDDVNDPLTGSEYGGGRLEINNHTSLITFKSKPASVSLDTLDYDLITKTLPSIQPEVFSSSITHVGEIVEGKWNAGPITADGDITSTGNLSIAGNAEIGGDLNVAGTITTVHSEEITTEENTIELRHDAQVGLIGNETSGIVINNYDGNNNDAGILLDGSGTLRIGDIGDTEPVATRAESADLTNDNLLKWDADGNRLVDSGKSLDDIADDIEAAKNSISEINGWSEYLERINPASAPTNITQIATQVQNYMTTLNYDCVVFKALMTVAQCSTYLGLTFNDPKMLIYTCDKSSGTMLNSATLTALNDWVWWYRYDFTNNTWILPNKYNKAAVTPNGLGAIYLDRASPDGSIIIGDKNGRHLELGESYYAGYNYGIPTLHAKTGDVWNGNDMLLLRSANVWVPDGLRIPTIPPQNPQPGNIWVII